MNQNIKLVEYQNQKYIKESETRKRLRLQKTSLSRSPLKQEPKDFGGVSPSKSVDPNSSIKRMETEANNSHVTSPVIRVCGTKSVKMK